MTILLAPLLRRSPAPVVDEIEIPCDRTVCDEPEHPRHVLRVETTHCRVADVQYRVAATLSGQKVRAPWNFSNKKDAEAKHAELVSALSAYAAASELALGGDR